MNNQDKTRIVFMGTPEFAVSSLDALHKAGHNIVTVVTVPDKPQGRGLKMLPSPVRQYAVNNQLPLLQPDKLNDPQFINRLQELNADLFIVIAFRILPEAVWRIPPKGTVNLHASLLPQYRGAAPIQRAVMNGETTTGLTTFFIDKNIDTGNVICMEQVPIFPDETAGELHDRLKVIGSKLVLKTVDSIMRDEVQPLNQLSLMGEKIELKSAPKILKQDCRIDWNQSSSVIHNKIRGLSPYPAAFTMLRSPEGEDYLLKIYRSKPHQTNESGIPGQVKIKVGASFFITTADGMIELIELQIEGRKKLPVRDFLNGFDLNSSWQAL